MESIEKLRELVKSFHSLKSRWDTLEAIDEVEREIERDYMKLPVDADGVPIRIGDLLECSEYGNQTERFTVYGYTTEYSTWTGDIATLMATNENSTEFYCDRCRHVKPRTLESILCDALADVSCMGDGIVRSFKPDEPYVAELAAEIRELMEVGK